MIILAKSLRNLIDGEKETEDAVVYCEGGYDVREQQCFEIGTEQDYNFLMRPECIYYPKMLIQQERQECVSRYDDAEKELEADCENKWRKMNYIIWRWMQKEEKNLYYNPNYKKYCL